MSTTLEQLQYGFDRNSRRIWKRRPLTALEDDHYGYDSLSQVTSAARGSLNLNTTAISGRPANEQRWEYDPTGNWRGFHAAENGNPILDQHRVHDRGNRLMQVLESLNYAVGAFDKLGLAASTVCAVSSRRVLGTFEGKANRIRKSAGSTEDDIGYLASGDYNGAAFSAFVGAGDGMVRSAFNQTYSPAFEQATDAVQPQMLLNQTPGGRAAMKFVKTDETNLQADTAFGLMNNNPMTMVIVARLTASSSGDQSFAYCTDDFGLSVFASDNKFHFDSMVQNFNTGVTADTSWHVFVLAADSREVGTSVIAGLRVYIDGTLCTLTLGDGPSTWPTTTGDKTSIGSYFDDAVYSLFANAEIAEFALFDRALTADEVAAYTANAQAYLNLPDPSPETDPSPVILDRVGRVRESAPDAIGDWKGKLELSWDAWSRITSVKNNGTEVGTYAYDGLHRRLTRTVAGVTMHSYYSDAWRPLEERKNTETTAAISYIWGARHRDDLVRRDRAVGGTTLNETRYVLMDYFNPAAITDGSGVVKERYSFTAFGVRSIMASDYSPRTTSESDFEFAFQGQFLDTESGLMNYGYRYYSPYLGRWACKDPIAEVGGFNLYACVDNGPVNLVDHLGLDDGGLTQYRNTSSEQLAQRHKELSGKRLTKEETAEKKNIAKEQKYRDERNKGKQRGGMVRSAAEMAVMSALDGLLQSMGNEPGSVFKDEFWGGGEPEEKDPKCDDAGCGCVNCTCPEGYTSEPVFPDPKCPKGGSTTKPKCLRDDKWKSKFGEGAALKGWKLA